MFDVLHTPGGFTGLEFFVNFNVLFAVDEVGSKSDRRVGGHEPFEFNCGLVPYKKSHFLWHTK
mgnify:CR=1 FL=1